MNLKPSAFCLISECLLDTWRLKWRLKWRLETSDRPHLEPPSSLYVLLRRQSEERGIKLLEICARCVVGLNPI